MAILVLQKLGQQVSPRRCSYLPNGMANAVFTNRRENLKSQSVLLIKLNRVLGDILDFPKSCTSLEIVRADASRSE
jgi:hypothetical protein